MAAKAENLNRLVENQDPDLNLQVALSHTLTRRTLRTFKSSRKLTGCDFGSLQRNRETENLS